MSFTIRKVAIDDSLILYKMVENYHLEMNLGQSVFNNTMSKFIKYCFEEKNKINFFIAEFNGNVLGYCAFVCSYSVNNGASISINEIYVKKEYRKIGVSTFFFSKIIDIAYEGNSYDISWRVNITNKNLIEIMESVGISVNTDLLIVNIYRDKISYYLENNKVKEGVDVHFAKNYELPDIYECIVSLANESDDSVNLDVYQLMKDGFSMNEKFKIIAVTTGDEVSGFLSFYEAYCTDNGKYIAVDKLFIKKEFRAKGFGQTLLTSLLTYAYSNDFEKVEYCISKYEVEKIERLKEFEIYPYENLRLASFKKEDYKEIHK